MKMILFIFVAATMPVFTFAADIALKDGRMLQEATVMSQTPRTVTIRHAVGLSSVAKELLPPELQAQYPVDEAAAREAEAKAGVAREAALTARKAESERLARVRADREATAAAFEASQAKEAAQKRGQLAAVRANARSLAERYFEKDYGWSPTGSRSASVTIYEVRPADGIDGRWFVTGRAVIATRSSTSGYSTYRQGGNSASEWRSQYNDNQIAYQNRQAYEDHRRDHADATPDQNRHVNENQACPTPSPKRDDKTHPPSDTKHPPDASHQREERYPEVPLFPSYPTYAENDYTTETREFEAYYSTESSTPSISITLR